MTITEQVRGFILAELNFAGASTDLTDDYQLLANAVLDSMGIVQVVDFLEASFDIEIDDEDLVPDHFGSVGSIAEFVESKQAA